MRSRLPVAILRVAVGLPARAGCFRPYIAALVRNKHRLSAPLQERELVEHVSELPDREQRLAKVEVKDVVLARRVSEERRSAHETLPDRI